MKRTLMTNVQIGLARNRLPSGGSVKYLYRECGPFRYLLTPTELAARDAAELWVIAMNKRITDERIPAFYS